MRALVGFVGVLLVGCGQPGAAGDCPSADGSVDTGPTRYGPIVAAGPDADGDGVPDVVVGVPSDTGLGAVHLISGATGAILRTWTGDTARDGFGAAVSLGPDTDGDGLADVLVGVPSHGASLEGAVELYSGATGALLRGWQGDPDAMLGEGVSLGPDLDGDSRGDVAFTDALEYDQWVEGGDILHAKHGHVHLVSGASGAELRAIAVTQDDLTIRLGGLGPDSDGDGAADVLVQEDSALDDGAVMLDSGATGAMLRSWTPEPGRYYFGATLAIGPDADGDGAADVAISSVEIGAAQTAHVVLYSSRTGATVHDWQIDNVHLGGMAIAPDLDGDGLADVLVAGQIAEEQPDLVIWSARAMSSGDGRDLATWQATETTNPRYELPTAIAATPTPCGALVEIAINNDSPADGPLGSRVELHAVP